MLRVGVQVLDYLVQSFVKSLEINLALQVLHLAQNRRNQLQHHRLNVVYIYSLRGNNPILIRVQLLKPFLNFLLSLQNHYQLGVLVRSNLRLQSQLVVLSFLLHVQLLFPNLGVLIQTFV